MLARHVARLCLVFYVLVIFYHLYLVSHHGTVRAFF
jgi:hypothetical protein